MSLCVWLLAVVVCVGRAVHPVVINTWGGVMSEATAGAWKTVIAGGSAVDTVVSGCTVCELMPCGSVGFGGSPDENGETTLDALVMDGRTMDVGSVAGLRKIKNAIGVARHVLYNTQHTLIVGDQATDFGAQMGFELENLTTPASHLQWQQWKENNCQPNFWRNVVPNHTRECGPYKPVGEASLSMEGAAANPTVDEGNHDTIAMVAIDQQGRMAVGTSTNGATHKIPGRVGDSPVVGAGSYVDEEVGGCGATGDGDVMMRFLPCFQTVEAMRRGDSPRVAAEAALRRIARYYPTYMGGLVAVNSKGEYAGAAYGWDFTYSVQTPSTNGVLVVHVSPINIYNTTTRGVPTNNTDV